ncbi:D-2-hydroxyacid dehydrogenase [Acetobacterium wieringae]|uniref:D-2-hydroxyacid dehydrogenase n=1 Tax=Acetobacterium wieringae TaxID=52694 RepID=A0ABY6HHT8_9FIRM|nr:D-2-hydroxyacid dehydrogenase [Acetobacterium wieringae]UYO64079.1 D-2-hydroxyacid dehydrogenase [Acetobacterium wieringae]VUZ25595.1 Glycerate dehydrogenase [Acetobacterium wieringae]
MRIVVLDGYALNPGDLSWDSLKKLGELTVYDRTPEAEVAGRIGDAKIIFTNKTPITKETLERCPQIKYIGVLATGYNVVDVVAATERGITVTNIPSYGTDAVSQFAIALLLELCHRIGDHADSVLAGDWANKPDWCYWNHPLIELSGKTMGIIGYGKIGQRTGHIAQAMGMTVLANDVTKYPELESETCHYVSLDQLYQKADVIVLHVPLFSYTREMINAESIRKMKDGVLIINNSRGQLIAEADLRDALNSGKVGGAAVDVVSTEPIKLTNPLLQAKNIIITPHISWAPRESRQRLMDIAVDNLACYLKGEQRNVVKV